MKKIFMVIASFGYASTLLANGNLSFETKIISESGTQPKYQVNIRYPQIISPNNPQQKQFNQVAKQWAEKKNQEFHKSLRSWDESLLTPEMKANGSSMTVTYDLTTLEPQKLISLRYDTDTYFAGAAHPNHIYSSINYDLVNNKALQLADLFKPNSNYLPIIAKIVTDKIKAQLDRAANGQQVDIFEEGLIPKAKNYAVWNIAPKGIKFTFNEYQVAAYVFGPQEIIVPYSSLNSYLVDNSIVKMCLNDHRCKITKINPDVHKYKLKISLLFTSNRENYA